MYGDLYRSNQTKLSDFGFDFKPEMEPVNAATGMMEAMIESAQFDMKLMEAMLTVDAYETKLRANGSVNESAILALHEGAKEKVKNALFTAWEWLIDKLKQLKDAFFSAMSNILDNDYRLLKKNKEELIKKKNELGELTLEAELKYNKVNNGKIEKMYEDNIVIFSADDLIRFAQYAKDNNETLDPKNIAKVLLKAGNEPLYKAVFLDEPLKPVKANIKCTSDVLISDYERVRKRLKASKIHREKIIKDLVAQKKLAMIKLDDADDELIFNVSKAFSAIKKYTLAIHDMYDKSIKEYIQVCRSLLHLFMGKLKKLDESSMDLYMDMRDAEFNQILESTYSNMLYTIQEV